MRVLRALAKLAQYYLIGIGLLAHVALAIALWQVLAQSQLTVRQLLVKVAEKAGIASPTLVSWVSPAPRYADVRFEGRLRASHPRILLPELAQWSRVGTPPLMAERAALYKQRGMDDMSTCGPGDILGLTTCWLLYGEAEQAEPLLRALRAFVVETPTVNGYGNAWQLAFAYDFIRLYPALSPIDRAQFEARIEEALRETLRVLDESSASLWHGRSSLAAIAWLCAVVLDPDNNGPRAALQARAQRHFLETIAALELTEGWPEGYNYWIQERAFLVVLAASAYLNGVEDSRQAARVRNALRRVGYWTVYATRPDQRIEGLGDEGSRVDLKDETRRVIDLIAQATRDPVLAGYSRYLERLHGRESYYRDYRWGFALFNDPRLEPIGGGRLEGFQGLLPTAELFGRDSLNLAYLRSDWSADATFISFRAGGLFTHHGHYDAGHFSLYKGAPLAINSSVYGDFFGPNRLNYSIRSIAKNTLLILRPGETVRPNRFFSNNVADGGQRVVLPTGSAIGSVADWLANRSRGLYLQGGQVQHFEQQSGDYAYIAADLTAAYNTPAHDEGGRGGKVERVLRQLLYLPGEDRLLVRDRVRAVQAAYVKKWLLHTVGQPQVADAQLLRGDPDNGILQSRAAVAQVHNGRGWLQIQRLLPEDALIRVVGGRDYQYYVEADGDDTRLDGLNIMEGSNLKPWFDVGFWRLEIQPAAPRQDDTFLVVLTPSVDAPRPLLALPLTLEPRGDGVVTDASATLFLADDASGEVRLKLPVASGTLRVIGLPPLARATLQVEAGSGPARTVTASAAGVAVFNGPLSVAPGRWRVRWQ